MSADAGSNRSVPVLPPFHVNRVVLFAATSWELRAVVAAGRGVQRTRLAGYPVAMFSAGDVWCYVIQTGVGPQRAERASEAVLAEAKWDAMFSTGFAGGLGDTEVGALVVGTRVMPVGGTRADRSTVGIGFPCNPHLVEAAFTVSRETAFPALSGPFISTDQVVWRAEDKLAMATLFDAIAIDMESAALAATAGRHGVPFAIVRTVSDRVDETLPLNFNHFVQTSGQVGDWALGLADVLAHPQHWVGLARFGWHSRVAATQLTRFLTPFLHALALRSDLARGPWT